MLNNGSSDISFMVLLPPKKPFLYR
jgi:hypothetical protein